MQAELKVTERLNEYEFGVILKIMRQGVNKNFWNYQNLDQHYLSILGQPILCAFPHGRIGDGHLMEERRDSKGEPYYSFISKPGLEQIVGTISDDPNDVKLVEEDGELWLVAEGRLFEFYAHELVEYIREQGVMEVSVESEVLESHMDENDPRIEVFTKYNLIGVTILGSGVAPAIPGANIKALQSLESEFAEIKLRAASLIKSAAEEGDIPDDDDDDDPDEEIEDEGDSDDDLPEAASPDDEEKNDPDDSPDDSEEPEKPQTNNSKGVKTLNLLHKREVAEIAANFADKFDGYTVIHGGRDEEGIHLCLMAADGSTAIYSMESLDDVVDARKIQKINTCVSFKVGEEQIEIDTCDFIDGISSKLFKVNSELEKTSAELATAQSTIDSMKNAELKRRVSAAKAAAKATLEKFNANREEKIDESILLSINEAIDNGDYSECQNGDGEWCGEEEVCTEVLAKCAEEVMKYDKAQIARNSTHFIWGEEHKRQASDDGVEALLMSWRAKKI